MNRKVAQELIKIAREIIAETELAKLTITELGKLISEEWPNPDYRAKPYIEEMQHIGSLGNYMQDPWHTIVAYFLDNSSSWEGSTADAVKAELKRRLENKKMNG